MKQHLKSVNLIVFALLLLTLPACTPNPNEEYIQGTWAFANEFEDPLSSPIHVFDQWWFGSGRFHYQNEVAMGFPQVVEGNYRILKTTEDQITLELYNVQGTEAIQENHQLTLTLIRADDTLRFGRTLYYRAGP